MERLTIECFPLHFSDSLIFADEEVELFVRASDGADLVLFVDVVSVIFSNRFQ